MTHEVEGSEEKILFKYLSADRALTCLPEIGEGALRATQPPAVPSATFNLPKRLYVFAS